MITLVGHRIAADSELRESPDETCQSPPEIRHTRRITIPREWRKISAHADPVAAGDLEVRIEAVRDAAGALKIMLFDREDGFRKEDKALKVLALPAAAGTVTGRFQGLPAGRYAVVAYHDENGDGKLNLRFGMFPKEGYGLSNSPKVSGPPKFKDAAFDIGDGENLIVIRLAY